MGMRFLIASRLGFDYADRGFQFFNRGISGNRIVDLFGRWKEDTLNLKPDILSILIGVNDVNGRFWDVGVSAKKFEQVYDMLLTETKRGASTYSACNLRTFHTPGWKGKREFRLFYRKRYDLAGGSQTNRREARSYLRSASG